MNPRGQEDQDEGSVRPWDDEDIIAAREMREKWERYEWLWGLLFRVSAWFGGVVAFIWMTRDFIAQVIKVIKTTFSAS